MKRITLRIALLIGALLLFYVAGIFVRQQYGIKILVNNQSGEVLRHVILKEETHGPQHDLGDLGIGIRRHIFVQPRTESHINLEFLDSGGISHTELVVGYVESGYCGRATAIVQPGGKVNVKENIDIVFCKGSWLDFVR